MDAVVEVYRRQGADGYVDVTQHGAGQVVAPLAFSDVRFAVSDFFT